MASQLKAGPPTAPIAAAAIDRFLGKGVKEGAASHGAYDHADSLAEKLTIAEAWESYLKSLGFGSGK